MISNPLQLIQAQVDELTQQLDSAESNAPTVTHQLLLDSMSDRICDILADIELIFSFVPEAPENRQFEDDTADSEDQFRATFEQAAVGIAHVALDGRWLRVNDKLCIMLGYDRAELLALGFTDVTHPDDIGIGPPELRQLQTGAIDNCILEKRYRKRDGNTVWGKVTATVIRDSMRYPLYIVSVIEDITDRKQAEHALEKSLRILSTAEQVANMGSWEFDLATNTISRSDELCRIIGVSESSQDASFHRIVEMVHPDERERMSVLMGDAVQNRKAFVCKYRCIRPDKQEIVLSVRGEPIQNEYGEVIRLVGSTQDITLQEKTGRYLAQRSRMSALVADVCYALIRNTNLKRNLKRCSEAVVYRLEAVVVRIWMLDTKLNALAFQASAGMSTRVDGSLKSAPVDMNSDAHICRVARDRTCFISNDVQRVALSSDAEWADGESIVSYVVVPLIVNNNIVGVLELFSRTTIAEIEIETLKSVADSIAVGIQRHNAEDELRRLSIELERRVDERTTQLEAAIKEMDAFTYSVSHDLRAPLRSIDGFSRAVITEFESQIPDEARLYLDRVHSGVRRMGRLIEDLLRLSHMGRQAVYIQPVDMAATLKHVLSDLTVDNLDRRMEVVTANLPECLCDPDLIRQVFVHLLSNSLKFTRTRDLCRIEVSFQLEGGEAIFSVSDNGVGFDMQYAHKLFEPFQRLHRAEDYDGSGVGLAIVKRIVALHGGKVWAVSQPDEGATFYFTLKGGYTG